MGADLWPQLIFEKVCIVGVFGVLGVIAGYCGYLEYLAVFRVLAALEVGGSSGWGVGCYGHSILSDFHHDASKNLLKCWASADWLTRFINKCNILKK